MDRLWSIHSLLSSSALCQCGVGALARCMLQECKEHPVSDKGKEKGMKNSKGSDERRRRHKGSHQLPHALV